MIGRLELRPSSVRYGILGAVALSAVLASQAQAADTVSLTLQGTIPADCAMTAPNSSLQLGDITRNGQQALSLNVNCNAPFAYSHLSTNGGLKLQGAASVVGGAFASSQPYSVTTSFQTDQGSFGDGALPSGSLTLANAAPCLAASYGASCPFANSGAGVAINRTASLIIGWAAPTAPLLAGTYSDVLTVTVRAM